MHLSDRELELVCDGETLADGEDFAHRHLASCAACARALDDLKWEDASHAHELTLLDHAVPRASLEALMARARTRPRRRTGLLAASVGFLVVAGTAAAALPGSPVRAYVERFLASDRAPSMTPPTRVAGPPAQPGAPQAPAGVAFVPGRGVDISFDAPQDAGWHFLELGRCIERGQNLGVVLRSLLCSPAPLAATPTAIETALAFGGSLPAYRRHGPDAPALRLALELLLLDAAQPRSLMRQLQDIERHLAALPDPARGVHLNPSGRLALDAITRLRLLDVTSLATADGLDQTALDQFLGRGDYLLRELSDAICSAHFQPPVAPHSLLRVPTESP